MLILMSWLIILLVISRLHLKTGTLGPGIRIRIIKSISYYIINIINLIFEYGAGRVHTWTRPAPYSPFLLWHPESCPSAAVLVRLLPRRSRRQQQRRIPGTSIHSIATTGFDVDSVRCICPWALRRGKIRRCCAVRVSPGITLQLATKLIWCLLVNRKSFELAYLPLLFWFLSVRISF